MSFRIQVVQKAVYVVPFLLPSSPRAPHPTAHTLQASAVVLSSVGARDSFLPPVSLT